jgi:hypothetical protein
MKSRATTVKAYIDSLPPDRRAALQEVRRVILDNLPKGYRESMTWGVPTYEVPLTVCPDTYNGKPLSLAALASQKNYMVLYLMNVYGHKETEKWFREAYRAAGKKLDMGKSCVRFKKLEDLPLDVIGEAIARTPMDKYVAYYEKTRKR